MEELYHTRSKAYNILDKIIQDEYISRNVEKGIYNYTIWKSKRDVKDVCGIIYTS